MLDISDIRVRPEINFPIENLIQIPKAEYDYLKGRSAKLDILLHTFLEDQKAARKHMREVLM